MNTLMSEITNSIAKNFGEDIDKAILNFCKEKGYEVKTPNDLIKVQNELAKEDKMIRCETFIKVDGTTAKQIVLIFIDSVSCPLSRKAIYEISKLNEQGYSFY